jgi:hypothetical protein
MAKKRKNAAACTEGALPDATPENADKAALMPMSSGVGPVPVAPPASLQLAPVIRPDAFVPFMAEEPPFRVQMKTEAAPAPEAVPSQEPVKIADNVCVSPRPKTKKKVSGAGLLLVLFGLLTAGIFIIGEYVASVADYVKFYALDSGMQNGVDIYKTVYRIVTGGKVFVLENALPGAVALGGLFSLLTLLASLIRICKKGACIFAKITSVFALLFFVIAMVLCFAGQIETGIGLYAAGGLSLLSMLTAFLARGD